MPDATTIVYTSTAEGLRPDPSLTVSEWADAYRHLPQKSSAEPGPWRTSRTPYLREPMDCLSADSPLEEVTFMAAAQLGKTEMLLNAIGYAIDNSPGPILAVQPTVQMAKRFSRQRIDPLVEWTPQLRGKVADARTRDSANSMFAKDFLGGILVLTGANSAVGLRSMPVRYLLLDEIDAYPADVDEEGDPIDLAEARQRTFARRKRLKVSTPGVAGYSKIEASYLASDRRRYYVPCPDCGERQPLEFSRLVWTELNLPPSRAMYKCRACGFLIGEQHKTAMLAAGEWRPENPNADPKRRGYHLSALYSPVGWLSWGEIASRFVSDHRNPEKFRVFVNTILAETWKQKAEAPEWRRLHEREKTYAVGSVPAGVLFLTAGVDVQRDRLKYEVVGWGRGKTSWSIDADTLPGSTSDLDQGPWSKLSQLLDRRYRHAHGTEMWISLLAVDSGDNTQTVYGWARRYPMNRVIAIKGQESGHALIRPPMPVEVTARGRKLKRGYRVWPVCGDVAKTEFYGWLALDPPTEGAPTPPGFCHFPPYGEWFFKELTAEQLVTTKNRRGYVRLEWTKIPGRDNDHLDARVYARAAAAVVGLDRFQESDWQALEAAVGTEPPEGAYDDEVPDEETEEVTV